MTNFWLRTSTDLRSIDLADLRDGTMGAVDTTNHVFTIHGALMDYTVRGSNFNTIDGATGRPISGAVFQIQFGVGGTANVWDGLTLSTSAFWALIDANDGAGFLAAALAGPGEFEAMAPGVYFLDGGDGTDTLTGTAGSGTLQGGTGDDRLVGAGNGFFAGYGDATSGVTVDLAIATGQTVGGGRGVDTLAGMRNLEGSDYDDTLWGDTNGNVIRGGAGGDIIIARDGADSITGGAGQDNIDAGAGADLILWTGARSSMVQHSYISGGRTYTLVNDQVGSEGSDVTTGAEALSFAGTTFALVGVQQNHLAAVDGGRFDDVLVQRVSTGQVGYIDMDGTAGTGGLKNILGALPAGWKPVGSGSMVTFEARAAVFIQNENTGAIYHYRVSTGDWGTVSASLTPDWTFKGVGDFTGDGVIDVVIRNQATGVIMYAEMNAGGVFGAWANVTNMGTGWTTIGVGDFDKDGLSDVLVQNLTSGLTYYANMDGGALNGWGFVAGGLGTDWVAKEAIDLNADGYFDVVFQNTATGQVWYVDMQGGSQHHWGIIGALPGWDVVGSGDYDNDGYGDVLVRNPADGVMYYADMDNGVFTGWGVVSAGLGTGWVAA